HADVAARRVLRASDVSPLLATGSAARRFGLGRQARLDRSRLLAWCHGEGGRRLSQSGVFLVTAFLRGPVDQFLGRRLGLLARQLPANGERQADGAHVILVVVALAKREGVSAFVLQFPRSTEAILAADVVEQLEARLLAGQSERGPIERGREALGQDGA